MVNLIPSEILEKYPDYIDLLLNCTIACRIVYDPDPIYLLKSSPFVDYNHSLNKICFSYQHTCPLAKHLNPLNDIKYLLSDIGNKRILAAFRGSMCISDFITDVRINSSSNAYMGKIHSGFFDRSESVPLNYLVKKLSQGYRIILTGHSLGAAVSCLIAVKLILDTKVGFENSDKILFIGFGCPLIGDQNFKNNLEKLHRNNFHFIKNEDDIVVISLDYLTNKVHSEIDFSNQPNDGSLFSTFQKGLQFAKPIIQNIIPKYEQFGIQFQLDKFGLKMVDRVEMDSVSELGNLNTLISQAYNHFIQNYFFNFESNYFSNLKGRNSKLYEIINDLNLSENDEHNLRILKTLDTFDIHISFNHIENKENILCAKLVFGEQTAFNLNDPLKDNLCFKFQFQSVRILSHPLDLTIIGHFNSVRYIINFNQNVIEEKLSSNNLNKMELATKALTFGLRFLSKK